ncbi:MAG: hypothetical protein R3E04_09860 [Sphingobium sp.]
MAQASDTSSAPKPRARKAAPRKTAGSATKPKKAAAPKTGAAKTATTDFSESIDLARAAINSATAVARAKMKGAGDTARTKFKDTANTASTEWKTQSAQVKGEASKMARTAADGAKVKTGSAMHSLAKLISDTADTVDSKLGPQYGDYARQAASAVAGAATSLDDKDVDQLLLEAKEFVKKSPAVSIGAAAIAGYVLMRLAKGSSDD